MSEEGIHPGVIINDVHEEFVQHVEAGASRVRLLGMITIGVTLVLIASYFSQLLLPYASGTRYVQVDLLDPTLVGTQILLIILTGAWLYVGVVNYLFATRMRKTVKEARVKERELEKEIAG